MHQEQSFNQIKILASKSPLLPSPMSAFIFGADDCEYPLSARLYQLPQPSNHGPSLIHSGFRATDACWLGACFDSPVRRQKPDFRGWVFFRSSR